MGASSVFSVESATTTGATPIGEREGLVGQLEPGLLEFATQIIDPSTQLHRRRRIIKGETRGQSAL